MMPPLSTLRLCLQPVTLQDVSGIHSIIHDPVFIQASYGCQMPASENQLLRWTISQQRQHQSGKGCCYTVRRALEQELIGLVSLHPTEQHIELSYWLSPSFWRQGLMTEAVMSVLSEWRRHYSQLAVHSCCHRNNLASAALLKRVGMRMMTTESQDGNWQFISGSAGTEE